MNLLSWNINGLNSSIEKGLIQFIENQNADIYILQEIKTNNANVNSKMKSIEKKYDIFWNASDKRGYAGVASLVKKDLKVLSSKKDLGIPEFDEEGRVLVVEFPNFFLLNVYFVNAGRDLENLEKKEWFNKEFTVFCDELRKDKPLVIGGDFNVAHKEKDLARPGENHRNAGFTMEEREWFTRFLKKGFIDTFRELNDEEGHFTYWPYQRNARKKNIGWRIDYWLISKELKEALVDSRMKDKVKGSDHCPIILELGIN